jgi:putative membrane protein
VLSIKYARDDTKAMKKTLILAVDRDDDFGAKGGVESPAIGMDACYKAAAALGTADPEDSDTNALYAAMNIYRQMEADGDNPPGSFEVALICGNKKVGYKSDEALVEQLDRVIEEVKPDPRGPCQ